MSVMYFDFGRAIMMISKRYWIAGLLVLSAISLSLLVPGGPIETRVSASNFVVKITDCCT